MLKTNLLLKKLTNFMGVEMYMVLFLYEHKNIGRFSNLH